MHSYLSVLFVCFDYLQYDNDMIDDYLYQLVCPKEKESPASSASTAPTNTTAPPLAQPAATTATTAHAQLAATTTPDEEGNELFPSLGLLLK